MSEIQHENDPYLNQFTDLPSGDSTWLIEKRKTAMEHYARLGFPTVRHEEWRYTNVAPIRGTQFQLGSMPKVTMDKAVLEPYLIQGLQCDRLVFVNGVYHAELSQIADNGSVVVEPLSVALKTRTKLIESYLGKLAPVKEHVFAALNSGLMQDGLFLHAPKKAEALRPVHLLYLSKDNGAPAASHSRNLVIAEDSSQVQLIETYASIEDGCYLTNNVTEIFVGENCRFDHYKSQQESGEAFHIASVEVQQKRSSNYSNHTLAFGARLSRNDLHCDLIAEGCETTLNGLYLGRAEQLLDNHTSIDHAMPHCNSYELYKGILSDSARGVFNGKIFVHEDAQKTDAKQSNSCLLLSEDAVVDTKPQLEIFADDVRCTHGATIGQLDENALFYLRSRGLTREAATSLLTHAFANEVIDQMSCECIKAHFANMLGSYLPVSNAASSVGGKA